MMKILKYFFSAFFLFVLLAGCQRDDLCPASTPVTPLLLIEFYDREDLSRLKAVQNLIVHATGEEDTLLGPVTTNNIRIPLRTDQNFTTYRFIRNSGGTTENIDTISFTYSPSPEYLNRACGFIVNYRGIDANIHQDGDNWVRSQIIRQIDVENETEAHIYLIH